MLIVLILWGCSIPVLAYCLYRTFTPIDPMHQLLKDKMFELAKMNGDLMFEQMKEHAEIFHGLSGRVK